MKSTKYSTEIITQKTKKLLNLTNHDALFISYGKAYFYFTENFSFKASLCNNYLIPAKVIPSGSGYIFKSSTTCQCITDIFFN